MRARRIQVIGRGEAMGFRLSGDWDERPLAGLGDAARLGVAVDKLLRELVARARSQGCSWTLIGQELGISRQAAWERFAGEGPIGNAR